MWRIKAGAVYASATFAPENTRFVYERDRADTFWTVESAYRRLDVVRFFFPHNTYKLVYRGNS